MAYDVQDTTVAGFNLHHSFEFERINVEAQRGFPNRIKPPYLT